MFKINRRFNILKCISLVAIKINESDFDFRVLLAQKKNIIMAVTSYVKE